MIAVPNEFPLERNVRMARWISVRRFATLWLPGGSLLALGDCALSDQQLTSIAQSVVSTSLNTIVTQILGSLLGGAA